MERRLILLLLSLFGVFFLVAATARPLKEGPAAEKPAPEEVYEREERATAKAVLQVDGKYGALLLSFLPRGSFPPSGPSGGTNGIKS
ncbi:hypothetical protein AXF42_Ash004631 [Apostasia shenzhenica]|uniref:Uncharacterized protein n=1 Tax=Apostasia shenzhenica TaxID=1088818 RepID=A0A2I0BH77_9ASPA|nr:hypothetical protein AXF42_Ash004631 [Apostasia shenzhenica]